MNKGDLRAFLQSKTEEFKKGHDVVVYAAYPIPEKKNAVPRSRNYQAEEYAKYVTDLAGSR